MIIKYNKSDKIGSYGLCEWDYDSHTEPCNNYYGCITHIDGGRIIKVHHENIYEGITLKNKINNIRDYCLNRFVRKNFTTDSFNFDIKSGYYGDEPGCSLNETTAEKLDLFIDLLNNKLINETTLVEMVLIDEYGFILDELKNKSWAYKTLPIKDIMPTGGMRHVSKELIEKYSENEWQLSCVCQKIGDKFRLIDGYHRYSAALKLNKTKITTIFCK